MAFFDSWPAKRIWPVDMAGFAVNLQHLSSYPNASMPYKAGYEEDSFLKSINLKIDQIEPMANDCTEVRRISSGSRNYSIISNVSTANTFRCTSGTLRRLKRKRHSSKLRKMYLSDLSQIY